MWRQLTFITFLPQFSDIRIRKTAFFQHVTEPLAYRSCIQHYFYLFIFCTVTVGLQVMAAWTLPSLNAAKPSDHPISFPLSEKITRVYGRRGCLFAEKERKRRSRRRKTGITITIQFSPAAVAFINASVLSKGEVWEGGRGVMTRTDKLTIKHTQRCTNAAVG